MTLPNHARFIAGFFALLMFPDASAQPQVEALQQARQMAAQVFFDSTQAEGERLAAVPQLGYPDAEQLNRLEAVAMDTAEPDSVRLAAVQHHRYDQDYVNMVLDLIADPAESGFLASELIYDISQRTTFRQSTELRQALQAALRERLDDPRDPVRLAAYRALVSSHDVVAIDRVVSGVRDGTPPVPMADALELLDIDGPTRHVQTVRPLLTSTDPDVLAQAVRVLAVDPDSRDGVVDLAMNRTSDNAVRISALKALSREDENYFTYASRVIANSSEDADVRYAALEGAMRRMNYHNVPDDLQIQFGRTVRSLANTANGQMTSDGKDLGAEAKALLAHLQKHFPAIRRDFRSP